MVMRRALSTTRLWALAILALVAVGIVAATGEQDSDPMARLAVERYEEIQRVLWNERDARIDEATRRELARVDPARTGLVGTEWSGIVTTAGSLEAKRASASPGWVLVYRRWFEQLGLAPGDRIAINSSASFPALFYAARVAAESMGLECDAVMSLTASNHGATLPEFDFYEMERILVERGLLRPCVTGVTPGGFRDAADDLDESDRIALHERTIRINNARTMIPRDVEESLAFRRELLLAGDPPALYINIGGHMTGYGSGARAIAIGRGVIQPESVAPGARPASVLGEALAMGVPVLNMLDVQGLLADEGLSVGEGLLFPELPTPARGGAALAVVLLIGGAWRAGRPVSIIPSEGDLIS